MAIPFCILTTWLWLWLRLSVRVRLTKTLVQEDERHGAWNPYSPPPPPCRGCRRQAAATEVHQMHQSGIR
jgi:hypothetical protein